MTYGRLGNLNLQYFKVKFLGLAGGDAFQWGMGKCKASFVLRIEGIRALYPWRKGDHAWSCRISELCIVCPAFWTGGILSLAVT